MKAVQIEKFGHAEEMKIKELEQPQPGPGEVLIEVHASSVNPADVMIREGHMAKMMAKQPPFTLGIDVAGVVVKIGENVKEFKVGDKVYGQAGIGNGGSGAFAEYAVAPVSALATMPNNLDFSQSAAIVLTGVSALQALTENLNLKPEQKILIHGAAGGIGSAAVQLAKYLGAYVAATASGEGVEFVRQLGADEVIDYKTEEFDKKLSGYDAVFDTVAGETYKKSFKVLKPGGMIVSMLEQPDVELMAEHKVTAISQFTQVNSVRLKALKQLLESEVIKVNIDSTFPLSDFQAAFKAKESGNVRGKIVISVK